MRNFRLLPLVSRALALGFLAFTAGVNAQSTITRLAGEYGIIGTVPGDQVGSAVSFDSNGGWIVWSDNATDEDGTGISARRLDPSLSGDFSAFRVNQQGVGEQEKPKVAKLSNGGAAIVWQGGLIGSPDIFARFLNASGTFVSGDIKVNTYTNGSQSTPIIAALENGAAVVVWSSSGQDGSMSGVYGQILSSVGAKIGSEFQINQSTNLNQRSAAVAVLANGNFIVTWVSEKPTSLSSGNAYADIMGRIYNANGVAINNEFALTTNKTCGNPAVIGAPDGGWLVSWSQGAFVNKEGDPNAQGDLEATIDEGDIAGSANGWDIYAVAFDVNGVAKTAPTRINTHTQGDQFGSKLAISGSSVFLIWTSLGQDGSLDGVFGRELNADGVPLNAEVAVNTTTLGRQIQPAIGGDETGRFVVVWSSFVGGVASFDLFAQRFGSGAVGDTLVAPSVPYVSAINANALSVSWPELAGYSVAFYELYVDGQSSPVVVHGIQTSITNFTASTTHNFRILYQLADGRRSPLSPAATGTTWGIDANSDGLPDDWQSLQWGANPSAWSAGSVDSDGDGASNLAEFMAGTDPQDPSSVLKTRMTRAQQGMSFSWSAQPGFVYQVQKATNLTSWQDVGAPRFAHGIVDSVLVSGIDQATFYRVIRLR